MAEPDAQPEAPAKSGPSLIGLALWTVLGLISSGAGFGVGVLAVSMGKTEEPQAAETAQPPAFVEFGDAVANLDEGKLTRYLRINITLQVEAAEQEKTNELIEKKKAILKSWLLSYLSGKGMDDIRGRAGQNRLRREIQDHFNDVLFEDGKHRIKDVLFEEFNVQ